MCNFVTNIGNNTAIQCRSEYNNNKGTADQKLDAMERIFFRPCIAMQKSLIHIQNPALLDKHL